MWYPEGLRARILTDAFCCRDLIGLRPLLDSVHRARIVILLAWILPPPLAHTRSRATGSPYHTWARQTTARPRPRHDLPPRSPYPVPIYPPCCSISFALSRHTFPTLSLFLRKRARCRIHPSRFAVVRINTHSHPLFSVHIPPTTRSQHPFCSVHIIVHAPSTILSPPSLPPQPFAPLHIYIASFIYTFSAPPPLYIFSASCMTHVRCK